MCFMSKPKMPASNIPAIVAPPPPAEDATVKAKAPELDESLTKNKRKASVNNGDRAKYRKDLDLTAISGKLTGSGTSIQK